MKSPIATSPAPVRGSGWGREFRGLLGLALPLALTQLGQIAINTTDLVMMGWLGTEALAAGGLGAALYMLPTVFGIGLAAAVAPLVAEALGGRQPRRVRRSVRQGLWVVFAFMVPAAVALTQIGPLLLWLGQEPATVAGAGSYLAAAAAGLPFAAALVALRGFIASFGTTRAILAVMAASIVLNAAANYVLMFGHLGLPRLELVGAGLATSLVNALGFLALALIAARVEPYRRYRIFGRVWRPDWPTFRAIVRLGLPIALTLVAEVGMFSAAAVLIGTVGTVPLAAHNVALQLCSIVFMIPLGLSQAATIRVALAAGARDGQRVRQVGILAVVLTVCIMGSAATVFWSVPHLLVRPFLDDPAAQAALVAMAISFLKIAAIFQVVDGLQIVGGGLLRGIKDTAVPLLFALLGYWGIGFATAAIGLFVLGLGPRVVWVGLAFGLAVTATLHLARFRRLVRRRFPRDPRAASSSARSGAGLAATVPHQVRDGGRAR